MCLNIRGSHVFSCKNTIRVFSQLKYANFQDIDEINKDLFAISLTQLHIFKNYILYQPKYSFQATFFLLHFIKHSFTFLCIFYFCILQVIVFPYIRDLDKSTVGFFMSVHSEKKQLVLFFILWVCFVISIVKSNVLLLNIYLKCLFTNKVNISNFAGIPSGDNYKIGVQFLCLPACFFFFF